MLLDVGMGRGQPSVQSMRRAHRAHQPIPSALPSLQPVPCPPIVLPKQARRLSASRASLLCMFLRTGDRAAVTRARVEGKTHICTHARSRLHQKMRRRPRHPIDAGGCRAAWESVRPSVKTKSKGWARRAGIGQAGWSVPNNNMGQKVSQPT